MIPVGNDTGVAPALPVAAVPAATRTQGVARPSPTPPLTYDEARQRLRSFAAMLKHDNLVSGSTPDRERTVLLLEGIETLSVELDDMRSALANQSSTHESSFARVRRDITIMAGVVGSFPPLYEATHDRYTALVGSPTNPLRCDDRSEGGGAIRAAAPAKYAPVWRLTQNLGEAVRNHHLLALHQRLGVDVNAIVPLGRYFNGRLAVLQLLHDLIAALSRHRRVEA